MLDGGGGKDARPEGGAFSAMSNQQQVATELLCLTKKLRWVEIVRRLYSIV